jgi:preprotein translocase subunit SecA
VSHNFAIVDEVDSILIDEARTPADHLGAGRRRQQSGMASSPSWSRPVAPGRVRVRPAVTTRSTRRSARSESWRAGIDKVEDYLGIENLYESVNTPLIGYLNNAVKAKELFQRDKDYVVHRRRSPDRRRAHRAASLRGGATTTGMHQAIEAKEGVEIKNENQTLATITLQNYFRMYDKLSGMTGTAHDRGRRTAIPSTSSAWCSIPTNMPMIRKRSSPTWSIAPRKQSIARLSDDIAERHERRAAGSRRHGVR